MRRSAGEAARAHADGRAPDARNLDDAPPSLALSLREGCNVQAWIASSLIAEATSLIRSARYLTAFTGAGVSVESGIAAFRLP